MKIKLKDLTVLALAVLGIVSDINWLDVPFWVYLLLVTAYAGLRLSGKDNTIISK